MKPLVGMARTLGFGLIAALAVIPWQLLLSSWFGPETSFVVYAALCACAFPLAIAPGLRAAFFAELATVPLCAAVFALAPEPSSAVLGAALAAALGRSLCYRAPLARALALELTLLVLSLGSARMFGGTAPFGLALGLWSFFLVQSAYFLFLRPEVREPARLRQDPFDEAHSRALALLERR